MSGQEKQQPQQQQNQQQSINNQVEIWNKGIEYIENFRTQKLQMIKVNLNLTDKDMEEDEGDLEVKSIEDVMIIQVQEGVIEDLEIITLITEMNLTDTILT